MWMLNCDRSQGLNRRQAIFELISRFCCGIFNMIIIWIQAESILRFTLNVWLAYDCSFSINCVLVF